MADDFPDNLTPGGDEPDVPELIWPQNCELPSDTDPAGPMQCAYIGEYYSDYAAEVRPLVTDVPDTFPIIDAPASAPTGPPPSTPSCGPYDADVADVENINLQLDARGGEPCCSNSDTGCTNVANSGSVAVDLCADQELCVDCAGLANYVAGMIGACQQNGLVGGTQDIVEVEGLSVAI